MSANQEAVMEMKAYQDQLTPLEQSLQLPLTTKDQSRTQLIQHQWCRHPIEDQTRTRLPMQCQQRHHSTRDQNRTRLMQPQHQRCQHSMEDKPQTKQLM